MNDSLEALARSNRRLADATTTQERYRRGLEEVIACTFGKFADEPLAHAQATIREMVEVAEKALWPDGKPERRRPPRRP